MYLNLAYTQILSFHHVINIKIMNQAFYMFFFFFHSTSLRSSVYIFFKNAWSVVRFHNTQYQLKM